jgi:hypothetical protein
LEKRSTDDGFVVRAIVSSTHDAKSSKPARTDWRILKSTLNFALVQCRPHTGRTHQIRVHLAQVARLPIVADAAYAATDGIPIIDRHALHAHTLRFKHPSTYDPPDDPSIGASSDRIVNIAAPPPDDFARACVAAGLFARPRDALDFCAALAAAQPEMTTANTVNASDDTFLTRV